MNDPVSSKTLRVVAVACVGLLALACSAPTPTEDRGETTSDISFGDLAKIGKKIKAGANRNAAKRAPKGPSSQAPGRGDDGDDDDGDDDDDDDGDGDGDDDDGDDGDDDGDDDDGDDGDDDDDDDGD